MIAPVVLPSHLTDAERREIRRSLNAAPVVEPVPLLARRETLRDVLEAFADGRDALHGFPRHLVDWPALWAYCERNEQ